MQLNQSIGNKFNKIVDKIITRLGESNDSEITTAILAAFKLFFIPIATMSDKKSTNEQKKYTLKRDMLTESIALTGYIGITAQAKKLFSGPIASKYYKQKATELLKNGSLKENSDEFKILNSVNPKELALNALSSDKLTEAQKENMENLKATVLNLNATLKDKASSLPALQEPKELYLNTKKSISHVCVCTLALTVIPFVTNKILEAIANKSEKPKLDIKEPKTNKIYFEKKQFNNDKATELAFGSVPDMAKYMSMTRVGGYNELRC